MCIHFGAAKEFIPIIIGEVVWGKARKSGRVVAYCDNSAVVAVMNWRYDHDATAALLPFFFFCGGIRPVSNISITYCRPAQGIGRQSL